MADEKVRQAVEMAINRTTLINSDLKGIPWPTSRWTTTSS